ncbi:MAG: tRNA (guanosine(37)-N1)-methyltransferase TrmD [Thermomicrobiales bacterium]
MTVPASNTAPDQPEERSPSIRFDVFTLFPGMFAGPIDESIIKRARDRGLVGVELHDIRAWATDRHRTVDDSPYGGGAGMVLMAPPIVHAVEEVLGSSLRSSGTKIVILSPAGQVFDQRLAAELARVSRIALICGRYEGIDDRAREVLAAEELSIGDYVLTGGELAAMVVLDAVTRLVPGVIAGASIGDESHGELLVEYPHFTRPVEFRGHPVPDILLSGHHAQIAQWRHEQALRRTRERRPDLLASEGMPETEAPPPGSQSASEDRPLPT